MSGRRTLLTAMLLLVLMSGSSSADDRPNFLVILCDDLGYGDLGCYGHPAIQTPALDRLASQGMLLKDCYSASPVCSPSRCGLLTGRTPSRIGIYCWIQPGHEMHLPASEITIATLLRQAGYATSHVGKWHCNGKFNSDQQPQPGDHGFDHWFSTQNNAAPSHQNPDNFVRGGQPVGQLEGYSCQLVADEAVEWLRSARDKQKPFFQFVCFHEPHEPIASPSELVGQYPDATKEGEALYYANVTNMDRAVGKLLAALDELQLSEQTLVVFTSDNGPETLNRYKNAWRSHGSPGPLRGMKLHVYDGGIRVPGIVRWPGHIHPGQVVEEPVSSVDLLPTLCELGGVGVPGDRKLDGVSLAPLLAGKPVERTQPLYWHYYRGFGNAKAALRDGDWMVVGLWDGPQVAPGASVKPGDIDLIKKTRLVKFELYNLRDDVGQQHDRSADEPERLQRMVEQLQTIHKEVLAEGPRWQPAGKPD